jgi:murein DD-endopeptidase MepM/ murein hydrolase activator NlpD
MTPGVFPYAWTIARDGAAVGEPSPEGSVTVNPAFHCGASGPPVRFVSQQQPDELDPGQSADVSVTFANCSGEPWDRDVRLVSAAPATSGLWSAGNVALPAVIAPGFQVTTRFRITAPGQPGSHAYRWALSRGGVALDEPTPARSVRVRLGPGPCVRPVPGAITSPFGYRRHPIDGDWRLHTGIDFAGANGQTAIAACRPGVVIRAGWGGGYGNVIEVDHGGGMTTLYAHQQRFAPGIGVGVAVATGATLGYVGTTGNSTGPHLHFEVRNNGRAVDPAPYL